MNVERYCFWSVVDGPYVDMMAACIQSARAVGVFKDFHVWSERPVAGATTHFIPKLDRTLYLFKLAYLRTEVVKLPYDYYVWLDADNWFVRHPGEVLRVLAGAPLHASLESDAGRAENRRPDWWGCPLAQYAGLMRELGVKSWTVCNVNAGFWIVHREAIETLYTLGFEFWHAARSRGWLFTEEAPLAYAAHLLGGDPYAHTLRATADLWASDWKGCFAGRLPDGNPWTFTDYFAGDEFSVNPAIVHAMRSKEVLAQVGSEISTRG